MFHDLQSYQGSLIFSHFEAQYQSTFLGLHSLGSQLSIQASNPAFTRYSERLSKLCSEVAGPVGDYVSFYQKLKQKAAART